MQRKLFFQPEIHRHMMASSNGNIFRVTDLLRGEFTGHPTQRPVTRSFDVFFDLRLNERLSKYSWGWWFETPSRPLWRHINDQVWSMSSLRFQINPSFLLQILQLEVIVNIQCLIILMSGVWKKSLHSLTFHISLDQTSSMSAWSEWVVYAIAHW